MEGQVFKETSPKSEESKQASHVRSQDSKWGNLFFHARDVSSRFKEEVLQGSTLESLKWVVCALIAVGSLNLSLLLPKDHVSDLTSGSFAN